MKHAKDMSRDELLTLPIYKDESGAIDVDGANVFMPPAAVKDNLLEPVEDDAGAKWRVSLIEGRWMRYRSIASADSSSQTRPSDICDDF